MNIAGLRYFVKVAQNQSITKAARELYVTQPALSRHLQRLEEELGAQLFDRERGKMTCRLTTVGELCLRDAQQIIQHADNMINTAQTHISGEHGVLNIGCTGSEGYWLYEFVSQIGKRYPRIELHVQNLGMEGLKAKLLDGKLDLAYLDSKCCSSDERDVQFIELETGRMQLFVSKHHPFAGRKSVRIDELEQECFISWPREAYSGFYDWFCETCNQHGFALKTICYDSTELLHSAVYSGAGFGICNTAHRLGVDLNSFSVVDVCLRNGTYLQDYALMLAWGRKNTNPCLPTAIKLAKEFSLSSP